MSKSSLALVISNMSSITYHAPDIELLKEMLTWRRSQGSASHKGFCRKFIQPVMGLPDSAGNYMLVVGPADPTICFMAHHDSVHYKDGRQSIVIEGDFIQLPANSKSNCLGADCATGVWLILHMIKCGVPGRYVIHADEEAGGTGAHYIVDTQQPNWLFSTQAAVSFDRFGTKSVITHQGCSRTCSDIFADALIQEFDSLGLEYNKDTGGTFTDSSVYQKDIPECTNISVGYYSQHTTKESQSISHAINLAEAVINVNWTNLPIARNPAVVEYLSYTSKWKSNKYDNSWLTDDDDLSYGGVWGSYRKREISKIEDFLKNNTLAVAEYLHDCGYKYGELVEECFPYGADDFKHLRGY